MTVEQLKTANQFLSINHASAAFFLLESKNPQTFGDRPHILLLDRFSMARCPSATDRQ
jgi:hypothetical protein